LKTSLRLIVDAQVRLRKERRCRIGWKENQFTAALLLKIWEIRDESDPVLPLMPLYEDRHLLKGILDGSVNPDKAVRPDLGVRHLGMRRQERLDVEAKILTEKTIAGRTRAKSVRYYVLEGVRRFVDGEYGAGMPHGVMIGYVLKGVADSLAARISGCIGTEKIPARTMLRRVTRLSACEGHYRSTHRRRGDVHISLEHLLFQMV
jgi:hypothetical protein